MMTALAVIAAACFLVMCAVLAFEAFYGGDD